MPHLDDGESLSDSDENIQIDDDQVDIKILDDGKLVQPMEDFEIDMVNVNNPNYRETENLLYFGTNGVERDELDIDYFDQNAN